MKFVFVFLFFCVGQLLAQTNLDDNYNQNYTPTPTGFQYQAPLTDEQQKLDREYVHQEFSQRMTKEQCDQLKKELQDNPNDQRNMRGKHKDYDPCNQASVDDIAFVVNPTIDKMLPMVGRIYTTLFGIGGGTIEYKAQGDKTPTAEQKENKDLCAFLPGVTEMVAQVYQQTQQNNIISQQPQDSASSHAEPFFSLSRMHDARKQSANMQFGGWTATATCYAAYLAKGWMNPNVKNTVQTYLKASGAATMAIFFKLKANNHRDWANSLRNRGNDLKDFLGRRNCDPIKEKNCYCSMETTKLDPNVCLPKRKSPKPNNYADTACIAANGQLDEMCSCRKSNSCYNNQMSGDLGTMNFGQSYFQGALDDINQLTNNGIDYQSLDNGTFASLDQANGMLKKISDPEIPVPNLNKAQLEDARLLAAQGIPNSMAMNLASLPETQASKAMTAQLRSDFNNAKKIAAVAPMAGPSASTLSFGKVAPKVGNSKIDDDDENPLAHLNQKEGNAKADLSVIQFANKATKEAEISKSKETPLFDIISHRYRSSAWKTFDTQNSGKK